jgi:hypothetical protein
VRGRNDRWPRFNDTGWNHQLRVRSLTGGFDDTYEHDNSQNAVRYTGFTDTQVLSDDYANDADGDTLIWSLIDNQSFQVTVSIVPVV